VYKLGALPVPLTALESGLLNWPHITYTSVRKRIGLNDFFMYVLKTSFVISVRPEIIITCQITVTRNMVDFH
jgi:hypothetical protein